MKGKTAYIICGPTASGKTSFAIELAKMHDTEIISADSRQIYSELNIGVAKPSQQELEEVPHHLIGHVSIQQHYSVGDYESDALRAIHQVLSDRNTVVIAGGTGLYIKALCEGMDDMPPIDMAFREALNKRVKEEGLPFLLHELEEKDPETFNSIDRANTQRVIRAAEVLLFTGKPISYFRKDNKKDRPFNIVKLGLRWDKTHLEDRIFKRVDQMMEAGLLEEACAFQSFKHLNALQTVGYKELFDHFEGKMTFEQAVELIKIHTRQYAKRQMTWFQKDKEIQWLEMHNDFDMKAFLRTSFNI
ncbi:MAG: tRNA (adenosine(37)-N6)-dimethylallyltransferase MiaA [Chitinophagales bacterium]|nr:tRNA (adenosine(37)-N6)-dimethylallyltransferase MiaA [Chitinophagales bacterium]